MTYKLRTPQYSILAEYFAQKKHKDKEHNPKTPASRPILRNACFKYSISPSAYFLAILGIEER